MRWGGEVVQCGATGGSISGQVRKKRRENRGGAGVKKRSEDGRKVERERED